MLLRPHGMAGGALALLLAMMSIIGPAGAQESRGWQAGGDRYESPQFGYVVAWNEDWAERERETTSERGESDSMVLSNNDGRVQVTGQADDLTAEEFLDEMVALLTVSADDVEIVSDDRDGDVPSVEVTTDRDHLLLEAQTVENAVVVIALRAREEEYDAALAAAQDGITLNGTPVLSGEAAAPVGEPAEEPAEEPTEEPVDEPTEEPGSSGIDAGSYTSPDHGFTVTWDDAWEATENAGAGDFHELRLTSDTGSLSILSGSFYGGDPDACLDGEDAYFGTEDPNVQEWEPAVDANGDPITGSGEGVAYGVFTLTYGGEDDDPVDLVDYIECRALIPGETTLEIFASTTPELYEAHIAAVLEITNAIEMPEGAGPVEPVEPVLPDFGAGSQLTAATPEPVGTPVAEPGGDSGLDGNTFTSPSFGFTFDLPEGWTAEGESIAEGDETLVVSNGLSTITLHATDAYSGDLRGCISFTRELLDDDPLYADLRLDATTSGDPYQGADNVRAFALFTYTGADGEKWAHFVDCRSIVEGESVLILSQDVPYEDYASERQARRQIQRAIELP